MEQLKQIREAKGISQKEFASALGVTESAVSHWESGRYLPTTNKLQKIASILDCTVDELLKDPGDPHDEGRA
jgi:transcriptional regulator with XRE-family HTH domain